MSLMLSEVKLKLSQVGNVMCPVAMVLMGIFTPELMHRYIETFQVWAHDLYDFVNKLTSEVKFNR